MKLTTAQIVAEYNTMATQLGLPTVKKFQDRATAEKRYGLMLARFNGAELKSGDKLFDEPTEPVTVREAEEFEGKKIPKAKKEKKSDPIADAKFLEELVTFLNGEPKDQKPATTLRNGLAAFPQITRIQFKHSAIAAGFNGLTARNLFDRINKK